MRHLYWIEEGRLGGRCGPGIAPFDLAAMEKAGIGFILSLDAREARLLNEEAHGWKGGASIEKELLHLTDNIPPGPIDREIYKVRVPLARDILLQRAGPGKKAVLVHCHAGCDRTGIVLAAWIQATRNLAAPEAIAAVRRANPLAVTARGYEELALSILNGPSPLHSRNS